MSNVVNLYDQESDPITSTADAHARNAERYAAELIDRLGIPTDRDGDRIATLIAVAYLEGQCSQLKWARNKVRGDGPRTENRYCRLCGVARNFTEGKCDWCASA